MLPLESLAPITYNIWYLSGESCENSANLGIFLSTWNLYGWFISPSCVSLQLWERSIYGWRYKSYLQYYAENAGNCVDHNALNALWKDLMILTSGQGQKFLLSRLRLQKVIFHFCTMITFLGIIVLMMWLRFTLWIPRSSLGMPFAEDGTCDRPSSFLQL
jgi:hypothetical protein